MKLFTVFVNHNGAWEFFNQYKNDTIAKNMVKLLENEGKTTKIVNEKKRRSPKSLGG